MSFVDEEKGLSIHENGIGRTGARRRDGEARCGERANVGEWVGDVPATAVDAPASAAILPPAPLIRHRARGRTLTHLTEIARPHQFRPAE